MVAGHSRNRPGGRAAESPGGAGTQWRVEGDIVEYWGAGKATWEPEKVRVPTLLILAEWNQDTPLYMAQEVFTKLVNPPYKRLVVIGEGTHTVAVEKNRMHLIAHPTAP
jgi:pimeloyl-ACP methyl ester carboxylesterase